MEQQLKALIFITDDTGIVAIDNHTINNYQVDFFVKDILVYRTIICRFESINIPHNIFGKHKPNIEIIPLTLN